MDGRLGAAVLGERSLRIWLPDGSPLDLRLHLPEAAEVPALGTTGENPSRDARSGAATARSGARNLSGDVPRPRSEWPLSPFVRRPGGVPAGRC